MTRRENAAKFFSLRIRPWDLITACGAILSTATDFGFFGSLWWFLDLFSHFRVQFFLGLSAIALVLLFRRQFKAPAFFGVLAKYLVDFAFLEQMRSRYGDAFADWLLSNFEPIDFIIRLAEERGIVLLDGGGFDAPKMSVRVSLANLPDGAYEPIGRGIADQLADYHSQWREEQATTAERGEVSSPVL